MSTEDIIKLIAYSKRRRDVAHDNAIHLEEEIGDLEGKPAVTDEDRIILDQASYKYTMMSFTNTTTVW